MGIWIFLLIGLGAGVLSGLFGIGGGEGLGWEEMDSHISVPGIMFDLLNVRGWYAKWLGSATSEAKAAAARENGKKGGRPRSKAPAAGRKSRGRATGGD